MNGDLSERRLIENELIVRELNQKVIQGLRELKELAFTHDQASLAPDTSQPLHFYCECSDIDCHARVLISPENYAKIHKDSRQFIIMKGHQASEVERIVASTSEYDVVEKNREPSQVLGE